MRNRRKTDGNENTVTESTEDGQVYEHGEELTEDGQKSEHNKTFKEQCGIKRETITMVSLLFINLVIHCHCLALHNCVFSTLTNKGHNNEDGYARAYYLLPTTRYAHQGK